MAFRPEHGWWRAIWRTTLALGAAALLTLSASQAYARTSRPNSTPRAPASAAPTLDPSAPRPDTPLPTTPESPRDPAAGEPDLPEETTDPGPPDTPDGATDTPPEPSRTTPPTTGAPATGGTDPADTCEAETNCTATDEDLDVCDADTGSCDVSEEKTTQADQTAQQDGHGSVTRTRASGLGWRDGLFLHERARTIARFLCLPLVGPAGRVAGSGRCASGGGYGPAGFRPRTRSLWRQRSWRAVHRRSDSDRRLTGRGPVGNERICETPQQDHSHR
jgi:hypothetical protein